MSTSLNISLDESGDDKRLSNHGGGSGHGSAHGMPVWKAEESAFRDVEETRMPIMSSGGSSRWVPAVNVQRLTFCLLLFILGLLIIVMGIASGTVAGVNKLLNSIASRTVYYPSLGLPGYETYGWSDILTLSSGGNVTIACQRSTKMYDWLKNYAKTYISQSFNINLNVVGCVVPITGTGCTTRDWLVHVETLLQNNQPLDVDMIWSNGNNFLREKTGSATPVGPGPGYSSYTGGNYLYGPWATKVPSSANYDWTSSVVNSDFGTANDGYEMPAWQSNFVLTYRTDIFDSSTPARTPPTSFADLADKVKTAGGVLDGKFTYAAPSDSTGSAFIRHFLYEKTGGYSQYLGGYNQALYKQNVKTAFALLSSMDSHIYNCNSATNGKYCDNQAAVDSLFSSGAIYMVSFKPSQGITSHFFA